MYTPLSIAELYPDESNIDPTRCLIRVFPNTLHDPERWHMPVRQYFDGSGGHDNYRVLSLGAICATEKAWARFDVEWERLLMGHDISDGGLHMTDLMACPPRGRCKGWSPETVSEAVTQAVNALLVMHNEIRSVVCSIDMDGYARLKAEENRLIDIHQICVEVAFKRAFVENHELQKSGTVHLYFDQNEEFHKYIHQSWQDRKGRGWTEQFADIIKMSSKKYSALQAVDFISWIGRRCHTHNDIATCHPHSEIDSWRILLQLSARCEFIYLDYDRLKRNPQFIRDRQNRQFRKDSL